MDIGPVEKLQLLTYLFTHKTLSAAVLISAYIPILSINTGMLALIDQTC